MKILKIFLFLFLFSLSANSAINFLSCAGPQIKKDQTPTVKEHAEESFQKLEEEEQEKEEKSQ